MAHLELSWGHLGCFKCSFKAFGEHLGALAVQLTVEGGHIKFPHYTDTETIEQAKRQADWLSKQLTQSTGMGVIASPLVVIPGWFIENKEKPVVPVMNHKSLTKYYALSKKTRFDDSSLERINHQLEALVMRRSELF